MANQGPSSTLPIGAARLGAEHRQRFQQRFPSEHPRDELAACTRPPGWDESGFPLAPRPASLTARVWRLLER